MCNKKEEISEKEIRALIEGAYAQTPTLPGFWLKFDDFNTKFNQLLADRCDVTMNIEELISKYYPKTAFLDNFKLSDTY